MARGPITGLYLPGRTGNYASAPSSSALNGSGTQNIVLYMKLNQVPVNTTATLIGKYSTTGNQRMWRIDIGSNGLMSMTVSADGSTTSTGTSGSYISAIKAGVPFWLRIIRTQSTGAVQFSYRYSLSDAYTNLGSAGSTTSGALFGSSTAPLTIGSFDVGVQQNPIATIYQATVTYISTVVFDANFSKQAVGTTSFTEDSVNAATVTINQSGSPAAAITSRSAASLRVPTNSLFLPEISGNGASLPDSTFNSITGDLDVMGLVEFRKRPASGVFQTIAGKRSSAISYQLRIDQAGGLAMICSTDGSTPISFTSSAAIPFNSHPNGIYKPIWVRAAVDVNNGSGSKTCNFYYAIPDGIKEPASWTELGVQQTNVDTAALYDSTELLTIGSIAASTGQRFNGRIWRVIIKNGIGGTKAVDVDFTKQQPGATSFTESANNQTVTISQTGVNPARITGRYQVGRFLALPGKSGNYASTPDSNPLDLSGDYDIRALLSLPHLRVQNMAAQQILTKWLATGAQRSYSFGITASTGTLALNITTDGTTTVAAASSVAPTWIPDVPIWVRAARSGSTVTFYTSTQTWTTSPTWTQLGSTQAQAGTIYSGTGNLTLGIFSDGISQPLLGNLYYASIASAVDGTPVFAADFRKQALGASSFTEDSSNAATVTINTSGSPAARIAGRTAS